MATKKTSQEQVSLQPIEIDEGLIQVAIIGTSPFIFHAMSMKVKQELLFPKGRRTTSAYATTLKHDPWQEFRDSVYRFRDWEDTQTHLMVPGRMFKASISEAAKSVPGVTGTGVRKLVWVQEENVEIFGVPEIRSDVVRNSDINRTPDIRTRAILRHWACRITLRYVRPQMNSDAVGRLLQAAGKLNGIGDYRQQKGSGNFGQFAITEEDNEVFQKIISTGGVEAQIAAMKDPAFYDQETEELLTWFLEEKKRRFEEDPKKKKNGKKAAEDDVDDLGEAYEEEAPAVT